MTYTFIFKNQTRDILQTPYYKWKANFYHFSWNAFY